MKRLLTTGLVLLAMTGATASFAQGKRTYDDDIYYNSKNAKQAQEEAEPPAQKQAKPQQSTTQDGDTYSSGGGNTYDSRGNTARTYDDGDDYVDYEDDYYYSTRINRFNNPFYNRGYYSTFNNPYWYDPYWVDPNWGWSPWTRPGFSISFGAGPYWSSYWGWQSWYGYGGFNSYYGYPGYGLYGGYYSGYWNGYYAGLYNNNNYGYGHGGYRTITYGPRYSLDGTRNNYAHNAGYRNFRREVRNNTTQPVSQQSAPRTNGFRTAEGVSTTRPVRDQGEAVQSTREPVRNNEPFVTRDPIRSSDAPMRDRGEVRANDNVRTPVAESPRNNRWNDNGAVRNEQQSAPAAEQPRRERNSFFGRSERTDAPVRSNEQRSFSQPRFEQRSVPATRSEAPARSFGGDRGGGGRSFGGNSGGSGGGGFRGGRR